jgi:hypothetical protein
MTRLNSLLAAAVLPFKTRRRKPKANLSKPIVFDHTERNPRVHDDWLFEDERPVVGNPNVLGRLTASLCRLRNCLVDVAENAPLLNEELPPRYRVEFGEYSDLDDELLFDDELFDNMPPRTPKAPIHGDMTHLFDRSPQMMPA